MTETVTKLWFTEIGRGFKSRMKMVGRTVHYLDYELIIRYSQGCSGAAISCDTPIEWNMCQYIARNYF